MGLSTMVEKQWTYAGFFVCVDDKNTFTSEPCEKGVCMCVFSVYSTVAVTRQDCYQALSNTLFQHGKQQQGDLFQRVRGPGE